MGFISSKGARDRGKRQGGQNISFTLSSQTISAIPGSSVGVNLTAVRIGGISSNINISSVGLPSGVTVGYSNNPLTGATLTSLLTFTYASNAPLVGATAFTVTISATNSLGQVITYSLNCTAAVIAAGTDPVPSGTILFDTRSGQLQSWQGQGYTILIQLVNRVLESPYVNSIYAGDNELYGVDITGCANLEDGSTALRSTIYKPIAPSFEGGGGQFRVGFVGPIYEIWYQRKIWYGQTAAGGGGGVGTVGVFTTVNDTLYPSVSGRKRVLIARDLGDPGKGRIDFDFQSQGSPPQTTQTDCEGFYNIPTGSAAYVANIDNTFNANASANKGRWILETFHVKCSTTETSGDGILEWWIDGVLRGQYNQNTLIDGLTNKVFVANYVLSSVSVTGGTFLRPEQDQSEYYKDHVAWTV